MSNYPSKATQELSRNISEEEISGKDTCSFACLSGRLRITIARKCSRHGSLVDGKLIDSREPNTALGIEEPECVYVYVPANVFGANSL